MDTWVTFGGIVYGSILILTMFVRTPVLEPFRLDKLLMVQANDQTRILNLMAGLVFAGYSLFTLL